MITPFLEGEQSRNFRRNSRILLVAAAALGAVTITIAEGERQTVICVERKTSEMNEKRRLKGIPELKLLDIQNLSGNCRASFYRSLIGLQ